MKISKTVSYIKICLSKQRVVFAWSNMICDINKITKVSIHHIFYVNNISGTYTGSHGKKCLYLYVCFTYNTFKGGISTNAIYQILLYSRYSSNPQVTCSLVYVCLNAATQIKSELKKAIIILNLLSICKFSNAIYLLHWSLPKFNQFYINCENQN